jgi:hypothetical protein
VTGEKLVVSENEKPMWTRMKILDMKNQNCQMCAHLDMVNARLFSVAILSKLESLPFPNATEREFYGGFRLLLNAE